MRRHGTWEKEVIRLPTGRWIELARWEPDPWWYGWPLFALEAVALVAIAAWGWLAP